MKFGVQGRAKGIGPWPSATAMQTARRSGTPLGDWLNAVILRKPAQPGSAGARARRRCLWRRPRRRQSAAGRSFAPHRAVDALGAGRLRAAPPAQRSRRAGATAGADPAPNVQLPPALERAVAEFRHAARAQWRACAAARAAAAASRSRKRRWRNSRADAAARAQMAPPPMPAAAAAPVPAPRPPRHSSRRVRRCRRRTFPAWKINCAASPTRSKPCAGRAWKKRSTRCAAN